MLWKCSFGQMKGEELYRSAKSTRVGVGRRGAKPLVRLLAVGLAARQGVGGLGGVGRGQRVVSVAS